MIPEKEVPTTIELPKTDDPLTPENLRDLDTKSWALSKKPPVYEGTQRREVQIIKIGSTPGVYNYRVYEYGNNEEGKEGLMGIALEFDDELNLKTEPRPQTKNKWLEGL